MGCGTKATTPSTAVNTDIQGSWVGSCKITNTTSNKITWSFDGSSGNAFGTYLITYYADTTCTTMDSSATLLFSVAEGATAVTSPAGATSIDFTVKSASVTPVTSAGLTSWRATYPTKTFTLNTSTDVTGADASTTAGKLYYSTYKVSGTTLSTGDLTTSPNDGTTPAKRSDTFATFTKQ